MNKIRIFIENKLEHHRDKFPLWLHAFLIKKRWLTNRGIIYRNTIRISDDFRISTTFNIKNELLEKLKLEIWHEIFNAIKHNFQPEQVKIQSRRSPFDMSMEYTIYVNMYWSPYPKLSTFKEFIDRLYMLH